MAWRKSVRIQRVTHGGWGRERGKFAGVGVGGVGSWARSLSYIPMGFQKEKLFSKWVKIPDLKRDAALHSQDPQVPAGNEPYRRPWGPPLPTLRLTTRPLAPLPRPLFRGLK